MSPKKLTPAVSRSVRLVIAGGVWTAVGVMLLAWSVSWLLPVPRVWAIALGAVGVVLGALAWRALFSGLVSVNIARVLRRPARACMFGFTSPKGWLITASMIVLGASLRHSDLPRTLLAVPYAAIGMALFLASFNYYSYLIRSRKGVTS